MGHIVYIRYMYIYIYIYIKHLAVTVLRSIWQCSTPGRSPAPGALYYIILYYIILYHIISYAANSAHLDDRPPEGQAQEDQLAGEVEGGLDQGVGRQQGLDPPLEEGQAQARQRVLQGTESWSVTDPYLAIVARLLWCARGTSDGSGVSRSSGSIGLDSHHVCAANLAKIVIWRRSPSTRFAGPPCEWNCSLAAAASAKAAAATSQ
jgi:hypothetical protein